MFRWSYYILVLSFLSFLQISLSGGGIIESKKLYMNLQEAFETPKKVYRLCQGGQNLNSLPEMIGSLENLTELNLSQNNLTSLPNSFCRLKNLKDLNLSANYLKHLPENFVKLNKLVRLDLSVNTALEWMATFEILKQLNKLEYLDLSYNDLKVIPLSLSDLVNLKELILTGNQIDKKIISELKNKLPDLKIIM